MADPRDEYARLMTRRSFFRASGTGLGFAALATLLREDVGAVQTGSEAFGGLPDLPHFAPKAKRVIYLCHVGSAVAPRSVRPQAGPATDGGARSCRTRCGNACDSAR